MIFTFSLDWLAAEPNQRPPHAMGDSEKFAESLTTAHEKRRDFQLISGRTQNRWGKIDNAFLTAG